MEFLQHPIFTAFLALLLSYLVAKIVSFAVSSSSPDVDSVAREGGGEKGVILERGLEVRRGKVAKRVKFVDDVVIRRVDRYEGSENLDAEEVVSEVERVDQFGGDVDFGERESKEECYDERELGDVVIEGSEEIEMLFEKEGCGAVHVVKSVGDDDMVVDEREGNEEINEREGNEEINKREGNEEIEERGGNEEIDEREGNGGSEEKKVRDESDDDWEGVERSELERGFAEAVNYVECGGKGREEDRLARLGSDVQMQLYGLHKVALEGPCLESQPMALMVSARTKWNAWQGLGSMSRELAMEQYIKVLSENIPEWMHEHTTDDTIQRKTDPNDEISIAEHIKLGTRNEHHS
ncbi:acyl-CoA-binding domain-containing protein 3-like isoform X2 [Salvia splendens]|uniref:acyl-CoA-binding domain-containing protein 3-like isoform X2 n=1 Tax=Salvia splendens TaxID=180675 RepID=UPI001C26151C|nr:acyl-CoA-binding domain-containing protein 3-like isoform X2 [Salvia splendens]XP_042010322.1 acyl-CoA-binding domain-containing protein 3-like isoform X2 [Salvia splendens]XP_042010323.1 acyl-CoA-binding domain-containing protein 3-like isoform X2 [Salvia splendens]XP_042010324.1 acyl-CoA-binding domain-containing protein 3-like isoform X2 [Salvia splendens]